MRNYDPSISFLESRPTPVFLIIISLGVALGMGERGLRGEAFEFPATILGVVTFH
jgi:hypothetical protein